MSNRIIKKYSNRRLYDTEDSKYVTLKDIRKIIALGYDVNIIDDTSREDITHGLLLQIVSEQEHDGNPILSAAVLKQLIRFYGHPKQSLMSGFLDSSVTDFISQLEAMETTAQNSIENSSFNNAPVDSVQTDNTQKDPIKNHQVTYKLQRQFFKFMKRRSTKNNTKENESDEL